MSLDDFAHTASIDAGRLKAISNGYGDTLTDDEVTRLVNFYEDLKDAEAADIFDLKRHGLLVPTTLADVTDEINAQLAKNRMADKFPCRIANATLASGDNSTILPATAG